MAGAKVSSAEEVPVDIPAVVERMRRIDAELPRGDGFWWFNKLYLRTTEEVLAAHRAGAFVDPAFVTRWAAVFADLYFDALRVATAAPTRLPRAWRPLAEARSRRGIRPLQFALAGMNAHINRDLPVALFEVCQERGLPPVLDGPVRRDFETINEILARVQAEAKDDFTTPFWRVVDRLLGRADDVFILWSIERARDAAWVSTELLWCLRDRPAEQRHQIEILDGLVGYAGRGILYQDAWLARTRLAWGA